MKILKRWSLRSQKLRTEPDPNGRRGHRKTRDGWRGWLEGRAWLSRDFAGRSEKTLRFTWDLGRLNLAAQVYLGPCIMNDGEGDGVTLHVAVPGASLFLGLEGLVSAWLLPGGRPVSGGRRLERTPGREFGFRVFDGKLWIDVWSRGDGAWSNKDPWWSSFVVDPIKALLGKRDTSESDDELLGQVEIPMPEGVYLANATLHRHVWKRRLTTKKWWRISFDEFEGPNGETSIPYPGKGTTSYNCGMDGCWGISAPAGMELPEAIGYVVADVLRTRLKRTGNAFWRREPEPKPEGSREG